MRLPPDREVIGCALQESRVVEEQLGACPVWIQLKSDHGIDTRCPVLFSPGLHQPLVGIHFNVAADDDAVEHGKLAPNLPADNRGSSRSWHDRLGGRAELLGIGERLVNARGGRGERDFLVNALAASRNTVRIGSVLGARPSGNSTGRKKYCELARSISSRNRSHGPFLSKSA